MGRAGHWSRLLSLASTAHDSGPSVSSNRMWLVRLLHCADVFFGQLDVERAYRALEVFDLVRTDYRCGNARLLKKPGQCDLRWKDAKLAPDFAHGFDHLQVGRRIVQIDCAGVAVRANGSFGRRRCSAGKTSARQRRPRDQANSFLDAEWNHLSLFFAIHEVVVILHRDKPCPASSLGNA